MSGGSRAPQVREAARLRLALLLDPALAWTIVIGEVTAASSATVSRNRLSAATAYCLLCKLTGVQYETAVNVAARYLDGHAEGSGKLGLRQPESHSGGPKTRWVVGPPAAVLG
jgi:hypothetical protein